MYSRPEPVSGKAGTLNQACLIPKPRIALEFDWGSNFGEKAAVTYSCFQGFTSSSSLTRSKSQPFVGTPEQTPIFLCELVSVPTNEVITAPT